MDEPRQRRRLLLQGAHIERLGGAFRDAMEQKAQAISPVPFETSVHTEVGVLKNDSS